MPKYNEPRYHNFQGMEPLRINPIRGMIWREERKIAAPMLQAKMGGDKRVPGFFLEQFWTFASLDKMKARLASYTEKEWQALAKKWELEANQNQYRKRSSGF